MDDFAVDKAVVSNALRPVMRIGALQVQITHKAFGMLARVDGREQFVDSLLRKDQVFSASRKEDHCRNAVLGREQLLEISGFFARLAHAQDPHLVCVFLVGPHGKAVCDESAIAYSSANDDANAVALVTSEHQIHKV